MSRAAPRTPSAALDAWTARLPLLAGLPRPVVVGCSGGADSLALLALAAHTGSQVIAVHVDHGLREGSSAEAEVVRDAARRFGADMVATAVVVGDGPNLEARARDARYSQLRAIADDRGAPAIAVGHTADDQAETILMNILRGAAAAGLAGMAPVRDRIHRPLLDLRRADTEAICRDLGIAPVVDPSNLDRTFLRNRIRHDVLPLLEAVATRDLVPVLARQAELLRSEDAFLDALATAAWPTPDDERPDTPSVRALAALPTVLARRAVRRWLGSPPASLDDTDAILAVARGERVAVELAGRGRFARSSGRLFRGTPM